MYVVSPRRHPFQIQRIVLQICTAAALPNKKSAHHTCDLYAKQSWGSCENMSVNIIAHYEYFTTMNFELIPFWIFVQPCRIRQFRNAMRRWWRRLLEWIAGGWSPWMICKNLILLWHESCSRFGGRERNASMVAKSGQSFQNKLPSKNWSRHWLG